MPKVYTYILFFMMTAGVSYAQQTIKVRDKVTQKPLEGVVVSYPNTDNSGNITTTTNAKGIATFTNIDTSAAISFFLFGYKTAVVKYAVILKNGGVVNLDESAYHLNELVFSANKTAEKKSDIPQQIQIISSGNVQQGNPQTSADMLVQTGKVFMQMSQQGGGSPLMRGFESNRVLMVVDGVRMNNAIYRGGHLQNVITLDPNMLDRVEVMFGPGSVMYGSDALGGVMHFYTKKPQLATGDKMLVNGSAFTRYSSANQEKSGNVTLNLGWKKFASLTAFTMKDLGDLRSGMNKNPAYLTFGSRKYYAVRINGKDSMMLNPDSSVQKGSGYSQYDIMQKFLYKANNKLDFMVNIQYSNSSNVPRYDRLTEMSGGKLKFAEWYYGPQTRFFTSLTAEYKKENLLFKSARITLATQNIKESRIDRSFNKTNKRFQEEEVKVTTINADFIKEIQEKHELRYGVEVMTNDVNSKGYYKDIVTDSVWNTKSRYPDGGNKQNSFAAYFTHRWEINKKLILSDGIRFSSISLKSTFKDTTTFSYPFTNVNNNFSALNGNIGLVYLPGHDWRFAALAATGFRAGNLDDVSKFFDSKPGSVLVVPNGGLKPEYVTSGEITIAKEFNHATLVELNAYYSSFSNIIITAPYQLNGQDSIMYNGKLTAVQANQNKRSAYITGFTLNIESELTPSFSMSHSLTYTYGRLNDKTSKGKDTLTPLDHIPPVYGQSSFVLKKKKFRGEFFVRYSGWKFIKDYRLGAEDNESYATPQGMPGWVTFNLRTEYSINKFIRAQVALENMLDTHYRYFASGFSAPGRNVVVSLRANF